MQSLSRPEEIVEALRENARLEHAAILQYLLHAFRIGEGSLACASEEIAREEMRHFKWFCEKIVELGGDPPLDRAEMLLAEHGIREMLEKNLLAEEIAIAQYSSQMRIIEDETVKRLLARILSDEEAHHAQFSAMREEAPTAGLPEFEPLAEAAAPVVDFLNHDIQGQYSTILRYLHQSFRTRGTRLGQDLEQAAQEEMKHLGWLAEAVTEMGGSPLLERVEGPLGHTPEEMLTINLQGEETAEADYLEHAQAAPSPELRSLLRRIRTQEEYHAVQFREALESVKKVEEETPAEPAAPFGLTVGSLLGKRQAS